MLSLEHINLRRGPDLLLEDASVVLHKGWRVGLVGRNGTGKSSLFQLIMGELESDGGNLNLPSDWRLAMMAQEVPALEQPAIDYVLDGHHALRRAEKTLADAETAGDNHAIAHAHGELEALHAWQQPARAATLLAMPQLPEEIEAEIREAFYDQAHLIKEIRFFTGRTPKRLQPAAGSPINDMLGPDGYGSVNLFGSGEAEQLGRSPLHDA